MPQWTDLLRGAVSPMVPKGAISGLQEALAPGSSAETGGWGEIPGALSDLMDSGLENPLEALGGFASGALEGVRGMTTPLDMASIAAPGALGLVGKLGSSADDAVRMGRQAFDVIDDIPMAQAPVSMSDADDLIGDLMRQMAKTPSATGQMRRPGQVAAQGLESARPAPQMPAEFTPRGGEAAFNASRPASAGPNINLPPNGLPKPQMRPQLPMQANHNFTGQGMGGPVSPVVDPVGDRLAEIENALRSRFRTGFPNAGGQPTNSVGYPNPYGKGNQSPIR